MSNDRLPPGLGPAVDKPRRTLRGRLVVSFLSVSLVTIALLGSIAFLRARATLEDLSLDRLESIAEIDEGVLNRWVSEQESTIRFLAALPQMRRATAQVGELQPDSDRRRATLAIINDLLETSQGYADFQELFLMIPRGGEVLAGTEPSRIGEYYIDALFFMEGRNAPFVQNLYASPITSQPTITAAAPILDEDGRTVGVIAGHLNLERIDSLLSSRAGLGQTAEVYLVSEFNDFVSSKRFGRDEHRRGVHSEGVRRAVSGATGVDLYDNYRGTPVIGAYRWIEAQELALLVEMEQSEAFAPARGLAWSVVAAGLVSVLLLTWGVQFIAKQIARPLVSLSEAAHRVAEGDFSPVAPIVTDDEVGVLAAIFSQMTEKLRALYTDLTEQVDRTQAALDGLAKARDEAESATRAKSDFLARMSHEIRTPLNAVLGMAHLLQKTRLDDAQRDYAAKIRASGNHLLSVINEILDFSKLEADGIQLEEIPFALEDVFESLTALVPQAREAVEVVFQAEPNVPASLVGDSLRLGQVLSNLLSNAVKFTHDGEIHILAQVESADERDVVLRFQVRDTGIGIETDNAAALFDAFSQEDESVTRHYGGTGLGLSICRQLVGLMDGQIQAHGSPGVGSTFSFTARFGRVDADEPTRRSTLDGTHVLVSLQNLTLVEAITQILETRGAIVHGAGEAPAERRLDVAVVDWQFVRDGSRETLPGLPTVLLADAHHIVEATSAARDNNTVRVVAKPVTASALTSCIDALLSGSARGDEASAPERTLAGTRVLVVEDNFINQEIAREILVSAGVTVSVASNGQRALAQLEGSEFDLVLLDIQMPDMSGWDVARRVTERMGASRPAIVVLSADPQHDRTLLGQNGVDDYLTKPIDPELLMTTLTRTIGTSSYAHVVDVRSGVERAAGNEELYRKLMEMFLSSQSTAVADAREELDRGDLESIDRRLHNLKGVAGNLGALQVAEAASRGLEKHRAGHLDAGSLNELARSLDQLEEVVTELLGIGKSPTSTFPEERGLEKVIS